MGHLRFVNLCEHPLYQLMSHWSWHLYGEYWPVYLQLQLYLQRNVLGHHDTLNAAVGSLKDGVTQEIHHFTSLDLRRLLTPPGLKYVYNPPLITDDDCVFTLKMWLFIYDPRIFTTISCVWWHYDLPTDNTNTLKYICVYIVEHTCQFHNVKGHSKNEQL